MGPPRQRLTRIALMEISQEVLERFYKPVMNSRRFNWSNWHFDPRQPGLLGGMASRGGSTPPSTISAVPQ
jgi:hypothetical protein